MSKGSTRRPKRITEQEMLERWEMAFNPVPEGWHVRRNPKPIPDRSHDWDFWHESVDIDNPMCGTAPSRADAIRQIEEWGE